MSDEDTAYVNQALITHSFAFRRTAKRTHNTVGRGKAIAHSRRSNSTVELYGYCRGDRLRQGLPHRDQRERAGELSRVSVTEGRVMREARQKKR